MQSTYDSTISQAIKYLKEKDLSEAHTLLHTAIAISDYKPEAYNLLGVYYETKGDLIKASTFYRVSYYVDQSFKPAMNNLTRLSDMYKRLRKKVDYGE
ncbi:MAG: tetratricopeptide repeat protein [Candidatus Izemoplasmataceae bacterium]